MHGINCNHSNITYVLLILFTRICFRFRFFSHQRDSTLDIIFKHYIIANKPISLLSFFLSFLLLMSLSFLITCENEKAKQQTEKQTLSSFGISLLFFLSFFLSLFFKSETFKIVSELFFFFSLKSKRAGFINLHHIQKTNKERKKPLTSSSLLLLYRYNQNGQEIKFSKFEIQKMQVTNHHFVL